MSFSQQVAAHRDRIRSQITEVLHTSVESLVTDMQTPRDKGGRMRVRTGFLRASLRASTAAPPQAVPALPQPGQTYRWDPSGVNAAIRGLPLGGRIHLGYLAPYARDREYGFNGQGPDAFMRGAAMRWDIHVREAAAAVSGGRAG